MSWFKRKPEYGGKGGWDRWGGQYPTFNINAAWVQCNHEPEQPVQFKIITADAPVQPGGDGEEIVVDGGMRGGNQAYREHQNAKKNAAPVMITKTSNGISQPKETGIKSRKEGYIAPPPVRRGGNQGYRAYERREDGDEAATFFPVKLVDTLMQTVIPYKTGAPQLVSQPVEIAPGVEAQDNIGGGGQSFRGPREANPGQAELQARASQGRLNPGQQEWQERVAQGRPGTKIVIDSRPAKREVEKRELSKEEIKAMQDRDFLKRPQADKAQSKPAVNNGKVQRNKIFKSNKPTPERSAKIRRSDFAGLEHAMDALARGMNHETIPDTMRKFEAMPTPAEEPTAAIEAIQRRQGLQAWQWARVKREAWNPGKLRQNKLTARATAPEGPRETGVRRYHTTAW